MDTIPTLFVVAHVALILIVAYVSYRAGLTRARRENTIRVVDKETMDIVKGDYLESVCNILRQNTKIATTLAMLSENAAKSIESIRSKQS